MTTTDQTVPPLVELRRVSKQFKGRDGAVFTAVNAFSCSITRGETVSVIGESGSGKSTLGRLILGLIAPSEGEVMFEGASLSRLSRSEIRRVRASMQVVFQEPFAALNPRLKVRAIIAEPLVVQRLGSASERAARVAEVMQRVELPAALADRYPIQLSGGQQQRVGIARAIVGEPKLVVLDEPTASLDRMIRRRIMNLLAGIQHELDLTYLLITHDIASARRISNRTLVMFRGSLVEEGPATEVLANPAHPYTRALVSAELVARPGALREERHRLKPRPPGPDLYTSGCQLASVCPLAIERCSNEMPPLSSISERHRSRCWRWQDVLGPRTDEHSATALAQDARGRADVPTRPHEVGL